MLAYLQYIYRRLLLSLGINEEYLIYCSSVGITDVSCLDGGKYFIKNAYNVVLTTSYILVLPRSASHNELNVNAMGKIVWITACITKALIILDVLMKVLWDCCLHTLRHKMIFWSKILTCNDFLMYFIHLHFRNQGPYAVLKAVSTARMGNAG